MLHIVFIPPAAQSQAVGFAFSRTPHNPFRRLERLIQKAYLCNLILGSMLGAIIGDVVGSVYEFNNIKSTDFPLFSADSMFTDDSLDVDSRCKMVVG